MANIPQPFHQHHVARALRGAVAAGVRDPTVEVRLPTGATITVGSGKPTVPDCPVPTPRKRGRK
jgi:hypothetical protein